VSRRVIWAGWATLALAAVALSGCGGSNSQSVVAASEQDGTAATSTTVATPVTTIATLAAPTASTTNASTTTAPPSTAAPTTTAPPLGPGGNHVTILGDSVILGAQAQVPVALKGWDVDFDAKESRFIFQGLDELKAKVHTARGTAVDPSVPDALGRVVVIHLCTNYEATGAFAGWITQYMQYLEDIDRVVWVTCVEWSKGQVEANASMHAALAKHPNMVLADWAPRARTPGYAYADGIHLQDPGRQALADLVAKAVGPPPPPK